MTDELGKVNYTYDNNGNEHTVTDANALVTTYEYDVNGKLVHTVRPNETEEICIYNATRMLTEQMDIKGEKVLNHYIYRCDAYQRH